VKNSFVEEIVEGLADQVVKLLAEDLLLVFITGSYARKQYSSDEPNINLYLLAKSGHYERVNLAYSQLLSDTIGKWEDDVEIFVDLHPYLYSSRVLNDSLPRVSFTTAVFDGAALHNRWNLPTTIGNGWNFSYVIKYGDEKILNGLRNTVYLDERWYHQKKIAFQLYLNQLRALPHVYDWRKRPLLLYRESLHYAEEYIRDGIGFFLTEEEVEKGFELDIIHNWRIKLLSFYEDRAPGEIFEHVNRFIYFKSSADQSSYHQATTCYEWAIELALAFSRELKFREKRLGEGARRADGSGVGA